MDICSLIDASWKSKYFTKRIVCAIFSLFVWFAKLQIYTIAYIVLLPYFWYNNCQCFLIIKYYLYIHMKDVDYEYKYLKVLWSRSLFCWNIIKYLSLLHIEKEKKIFSSLKKNRNTVLCFWTANSQSPLQQRNV